MNNRNSLACRILPSALLFACGFALLPATPAVADDGSWIVRLRVINVAPDEDSGTVSAGGAALPGSSVSVDDATTLELDFTYMWSRNWGAELILATTDHNVTAEGSIAGLGEALDVSVLPPTLLLQYHFLPDAKIRPYVGLGVNFTLFYDEEAKGGFADAVGGVSDVDLDESFGLAAQVGVDFEVADNWFLNLDAKYLDIETTATIDTGALGRLEVDVEITPFVFGFGVGRRF